MKTFKELATELEAVVEKASTENTTMEEAEKLASRFLLALFAVSSEMTKVDLDARMRKSGLKAIKAAVYLAEIQGKDKKPTEAALEHTINTTTEVNESQDALDTAEVRRDELERYNQIFMNGHIYFRSISKGSFNG